MLLWRLNFAVIQARSSKADSSLYLHTVTHNDLHESTSSCGDINSHDAAYDSATRLTSGVTRWPSKDLDTTVIDPCDDLGEWGMSSPDLGVRGKYMLPYTVTTHSYMYIYQMHYNSRRMLTIHQTQFRLELLQRPSWVSSWRALNPLVYWFKGTALRKNERWKEGARKFCGELPTPLTEFVQKICVFEGKKANGKKGGRIQGRV